MMDEPERMLDQTASSLERTLLEEGRRYVGPAELRAHTLAALGVAATAGLTSGGALAWLAAKAWTTKLLLALSAVTLLVAVPVSYVVLRREAPPVEKPALAPAAVPPPASEVASPPPAVVVPAPVAVAPAPSAPPRAAAPSASSALRAELAALDAVRSTLANDDAPGALSFLDAYFRTFPRGRLRPEAEVMRIDALAKAGRRETARRYAQDFLKRHPNSVLSARVEPYAER